MKPADPNILTINGVSSSVKFALLHVEEPKDKPVIFAYPWLLHRLTYRRASRDNIHVRGHKEEGTITTPFDMTLLNDLDRFHFVMDTIDHLPQAGDKGIYLKQRLEDKLIEQKQYFDKKRQGLAGDSQLETENKLT